MSSQNLPKAPEKTTPAPNENFAVPTQIAPRGEIFDLDAPATPAAFDWRRFAAPLVLLIAALVCAAFFAGAKVGENRRQPTPVGPFTAQNSANATIKVHVAGFVKKPGVYTLREDARVADALQKAGGALPKADIGRLNLADWAQDGGKIVVLPRASAQPKPTPIVIVKEVPIEIPVEVPVAKAAPVSLENTSGNRATDSPSVKTPSAQAKTPQKEGLPRATTPSGAKSQNVSSTVLRSNPVDLNSATLGQLEVLPGVGPKLAERILAYRAENGPFRDVNELDNVKGIGEKTLEKLRPLVKVR